MNVCIKTILNSLKARLCQKEQVIAMAVYGSVGRGEEDFYSDIDMSIYIKEKATDDDIEEIKGEVHQTLVDIGEGILREFKKNGKYIVFTEQNFVKLEIGIKSIERAKDDIILIVQSRIEKPENAIIFDREEILAKIYRNNYFSLKERKRIKETYQDILNDFLYYYDSFLLHYTRGDIYRAYMNYTIAFYKIASMVAMAKGECKNLYQPWYLTRDILKNEKDRNQLIEISSIMDPLEIFHKKEKMINLFKRACKEAAKTWQMNFNEEEIERFIYRMQEKYPPFYNFRDIAKITNYCSKRIKIKKGRIYRSASLARYSRYSIEEVEKYLKENKIRFILDLRPTEEKERIEKNRVYPEWFREKYIVSEPLSTSVKVYVASKPYKNLYYATIKDQGKAIGKIFEKYLSNTEDGAIILHCEGGKDRTGIIVALLLDLLRIERTCIIEDYLASYSDTKRETIEFLFEVIDREFNGTENYLKNCCKVSDTTIKRIRESLVVKT